MPARTVRRRHDTGKDVLHQAGSARATSTSKGPSGARAEANRAAILSAARKCFVDEGFTANLDRVAEVADVSKVTVYNHFGSKEALCLAVIDVAVAEALDEAMTLAGAPLADADDVRVALTNVCRAWVSGLASRDMLGLRNAVIGESSRIPSLAVEWFKRGPERFNPLIGASLGRIAAAGRLTIADINLAVLQLSGLVLSPTLVYGAYGKPPSARRREELIAAGVDMFLTYYGYRQNSPRSRHVK